MSISANEITCLLGGREVLNKVSLRLSDGEKVALVGENGSGKSTILKCLAGIMSADSGEVAHPKDATVGYLPQEAVIDSKRSLKEELLSVFGYILSAEAELRKLEHRMAEIAPDSTEFAKISHRYDFLQHEMIRLDGYSLEAELGRVSAGLGFKVSDLERECREFSGGWQMRILLAKILLKKPDILLLDEPTNHLDLESILWLEDWIKNSPADVLMVSHERAFMDNLVTRIFEIHQGSLSVYRGNYTTYLEQREDRYEIMRRAFENQQQQINQIQRFIDRNRADKSRAAQVQSRIKQLEKIEELLLPPSRKTIHFNFPQPERGNKEVVSLKNCSKSYGNTRVLEEFDLTIYRGERIALVGLNGAGKSTLMKILAGAEKPSRGKQRQGSRVTLEYFSQYQREELHPENTVLNSVLERAPLDESANARNLLGAFLFSGDDVYKKTGILSGGEKTRLRLARMLYSKANLLLLDEPTNHLDVASRATLERALGQYTGTLVFVSHDRVFMDKLAGKILEIHNGKIRAYPGNFTDYLHAKQREISEGLIKDAPFLISEGRVVYSGIANSSKVQNEGKDISGKKTREEKRREAQQRNLLSRKRKPLEKEIRNLEKGIQNAEKRITEADELLTKPEVYTDPGTCAELVREKKSLKQSLEKNVALWEKKNKELEKLLKEFST